MKRTRAGSVTAVFLAAGATLAAVPPEVGLDAVIASALAAGDRKLPGPAPATRWFRRLSLDLRGTLPRPHEVRRWLSRPGEESRWIERFLAGPELPMRLAGTLAGLLVGQKSRAGYGAFEDWLADRFRRRTPLFRVLAEVVAAEGVYPEVPEAGWIVRYQGDPAALTGEFGRVFLGRPLACAQCHDHPYQDWTQEDFLALSAYLVRISVAEAPSLMTDRTKVWEKGWGEAWTRRGPEPRPVPPRVPGSAVSPPHPDGPGHRRRLLAEWVSGKGRAEVARAMANRVWAWLMGAPLVPERGDVHRDAESLPGLLEELARRLVASDGDLAGLVREIVSSRAYRSQREEGGVFPPRLLEPEEMARFSLRIAGFDPESEDDGQEDAVRELVSDTGEVSGAGEEMRSSPSLAQSLLIVGGAFPGPGEKLLAGWARQLGRKDGTDKVADHLFLSYLGRPASEAERAWLAAQVAAGGSAAGRRVLADAAWCLANLAEFHVIR